MPKSKKPQSKTRSMLKSARFMSKFQRNNTKKRRKQAIDLANMDEKRQAELLAWLSGHILHAARQMEFEGKIKPVSNCDGSFEVYYDIDDSFKLVEEMANFTTNPTQVRSVARKEFRRVKEKKPESKFGLKALIFLLISSWITGAHANIKEFSSPPSELSKYDLWSATLVGVGLVSIAAIGPATPMYPGLLTLAQVSVGCGVAAKSAGSVHRLVDHATGKYPLQQKEIIVESLGVISPGIPRTLGLGTSHRTFGVDMFSGIKEEYPENEQIVFSTIQRSLEGLVNKTPASGTGYLSGIATEKIKKTMGK